MIKICKLCSVAKDLETEYYVRPDNKKPQPSCKTCIDAKNRAAYEKNKEKRLAKIKAYDDVHKEERKKYNEQYKVKNSDKLKELNKNYYQANKEEKIQYAKDYNKNNRPTIRETKKAYDKLRMQVDINYKLAKLLRSRLWCAIRENSKIGSAVKDLGCTIEEFKTYIESLFTEGMSWELWGSGPGKFHLDHKKPLASFDLSDRKQFLEAVNYKNLQPLWSEENLSKGDKIIN